MTGPVIEQARPRLDRWPVAGIATARAVRLKMPRSRGVPAFRADQNAPNCNRNSQKGARAEPEACRVRPHPAYPQTRARLKTP